MSTGKLGLYSLSSYTCGSRSAECDSYLSSHLSIAGYKPSSFRQVSTLATANASSPIFLGSVLAFLGCILGFFTGHVISILWQAIGLGSVAVGVHLMGATFTAPALIVPALGLLVLAAVKWEREDMR